MDNMRTVSYSANEIDASEGGGFALIAKDEFGVVFVFSPQRFTCSRDVKEWAMAHMGDPILDPLANDRDWVVSGAVNGTEAQALMDDVYDALIKRINH